MILITKTGLLVAGGAPMEHNSYPILPYPNCWTNCGSTGYSPEYHRKAVKLFKLPISVPSVVIRSFHLACYFDNTTIKSTRWIYEVISLNEWTTKEEKWKGKQSPQGESSKAFLFLFRPTFRQGFPFLFPTFLFLRRAYCCFRTRIPGFERRSCLLVPPPLLLNNNMPVHTY
jgi:hypothetical protein